MVILKESGGSCMAAVFSNEFFISLECLSKSQVKARFLLGLMFSSSVPIVIINVQLNIKE